MLNRKLIDLLSDTVTHPTPEMIDAMHCAVVGDDVYGEDPTANRLEALVADYLGKESSCFFPSGTMANLAAILTHCPRGYEAIVGTESDIYLYEAGGASVLGGVVYQPIQNETDGSLSLEMIERSIKDPTDFQFSRTRLICIENPHNLKGGKVLPLDYLEALNHFGKKLDLKIHMDGARIFNAAVALGVPPNNIACFADSVQFCLSKNLAAPVGSLLAGSKQFIDEARRVRKLLGGGMRQIGFLAAAGIVAIENMTKRIHKDHRRAQKLADGLSHIAGIDCNPKDVQTNMVYFTLSNLSQNIDQFVSHLEKKGVRMSVLGYRRIRAAIHYHITDEDITNTIRIVNKVQQELLECLSVCPA